MLEGVGVDLAALERLVRLGVVVEGDDLDRQPLLGGLIGDDAPDVLVLAAHDADLDRRLVLGLGRSRHRRGEGCDGCRQQCGKPCPAGDGPRSRRLRRVLVMDVPAFTLVRVLGGPSVVAVGKSQMIIIAATNGHLLGKAGLKNPSGEVKCRGIFHQVYRFLTVCRPRLLSHRKPGKGRNHAADNPDGSSPPRSPTASVSQGRTTVDPAVWPPEHGLRPCPSRLPVLQCGRRAPRRCSLGALLQEGWEHGQRHCTERHPDPAGSGDGKRRSLVATDDDTADLRASPVFRSLFAFRSAASSSSWRPPSGQIVLNRWNEPFYDAIERRDLAAFFHQLMVFAAIAGVLLLFNVSQPWLNQMIPAQAARRPDARPDRRMDAAAPRLPPGQCRARSASIPTSACRRMRATSPS